jgi:outer membrane protein assembly factor BamB
MQVVIVLLSLLAATEAAEESWWQFLGPNGNGHTVSNDLPTNWTDHENVAWKTAIHDRGWSSPVITKNLIWITTATADGHKLFAVCVDRNSGEVVHDLHIFDVENPQKITNANTYATPTSVVKEGRVFVHFGTYGTACLNTTSGRKLWARRDLKCDHEANAGPASSPTIIGDNLVVHVDGRDVQYIIALNTETGKTVWKTDRSFDLSDVAVNQRKAYGMPGIAPRGDGIQLISPAAQGVFSYGPGGKELWKVRHKGWSVFPRPVTGHGLVFAIVDRDHPELWAIRHDGSGDVTETHIAWKETRSMPARCTPLLVDNLLYVVNRGGIITCLEAKNGDVVWKERLAGQYSATPIFARDRIYLFNEDAVCTMIRPGRKFSVMSASSLAKQQLLATPAVDRNAFIIRTAGFLYRVQAGVTRK